MTEVENDWGRSISRRWTRLIGSKSEHPPMTQVNQAAKPKTRYPQTAPPGSCRRLNRYHCCDASMPNRTTQCRQGHCVFFLPPHNEEPISLCACNRRRMVIAGSPKSLSFLARSSRQTTRMDASQNRNVSSYDAFI